MLSCAFWKMQCREVIYKKNMDIHILCPQDRMIPEGLSKGFHQNWLHLTHIGFVLDNLSDLVLLRILHCKIVTVLQNCFLGSF